jgi:ABC transporter substrate binding protein (PQQ-dependent alcohol dehydrogenase system)
VRSLGEAVTRTNGKDPKVLRDYLRSTEFQIGAFKGEALTFRTWNQQMRQPILLAAPRILVSVSPQEGFLHERTPLDTLGFDEPESSCRLE